MELEVGKYYLVSVSYGIYTGIAPFIVKAYPNNSNTSATEGSNTWTNAMYMDGAFAGYLGRFNLGVYKFTKLTPEEITQYYLEN